mgnify:CR=1 FL=1
MIPLPKKGKGDKKRIVVNIVILLNNASTVKGRAVLITLAPKRKGADNQRLHYTKPNLLTLKTFFW